MNLLQRGDGRVARARRVRQRLLEEIVRRGARPDGDAKRAEKVERRRKVARPAELGETRTLRVDAGE